MKIRGGSRTAGTSKMEHFVITVNGQKPLTIIIKSSILDVAAVLDPPLKMDQMDQISVLQILIIKCFTVSSLPSNWKKKPCFDEFSMPVCQTYKKENPQACNNQAELMHQVCYKTCTIDNLCEFSWFSLQAIDVQRYRSSHWKCSMKKVVS